MDDHRDHSEPKRARSRGAEAAPASDALSDVAAARTIMDLAPRIAAAVSSGAPPGLRYIAHLLIYEAGQILHLAEAEIAATIDGGGVQSTKDR